MLKDVKIPRMFKIQKDKLNSYEKLCGKFVDFVPVLRLAN